MAPSTDPSPAGSILRRARSPVGRVVRFLLLAGLPAVAAAPVATDGARAQIPTEFENLQVLPRDIPRDSLLRVMRGFSFALGVRCSHCHEVGDERTFEGARFHADRKEPKEKARFMIRMLARINDELLPAMEGRSDPPVRLECKSCHRGRPRPLLLRQELRRALDAGGADSAVALYRRLREEGATRGRFDFGEWETTVLAEGLADEGRVDAAIAVLELNEEYHPRSSAVPYRLGQLYEERGRTDDAVAAYRRTLLRSPGHPGATERLGALTEGGEEPPG